MFCRRVQKSLVHGVRGKHGKTLMLIRIKTSVTSAISVYKKITTFFVSLKKNFVIFVALW